MKEAIISKETLVLCPPRLSTVIRSHFSQGGEGSRTLQGALSPVQSSTFWEDWGSVAEPKVTRTAQAADTFAVQLCSANQSAALYSGTKILHGWGEEGDTCYASSQVPRGLLAIVKQPGCPALCHPEASWGRPTSTLIGSAGGKLSSSSRHSQGNHTPRHPAHLACSGLEGWVMVCLMGMSGSRMDMSTRRSTKRSGWNT